MQLDSADQYDWYFSNEEAKTRLRATVQSWKGAQWSHRGSDGSSCQCMTGVRTDCLHFPAHALEGAKAIDKYLLPKYAVPMTGDHVREKIVAGITADDRFVLVWSVSDKVLEVALKGDKQLVHHQPPMLLEGDVLLFFQGPLDAHPAIVYDAARRQVAQCTMKHGVIIHPLHSGLLFPKLFAVYRVGRRKEIV